MNILNTKKILLGGLLLALAISIPFTLSLLQERQQTKSKAAASTTLSFTPISSTSSPIQKNVDDTFSLDMMVDPGSNFVTFIRFQIAYDPTKVQLVSQNPFMLNNTAFPLIIEGPITGTNTFAASVSVGSDPTKAIRTPTKVGTLTFRAIEGTGTQPTTVSFGTMTQALSAGPNDQAAENILSTTTPATITITDQPATTVSFNLLLHGIGAAGDNPNPTGNSLSNKSPMRPQRNLELSLYNSTNQLVASTTGTITYASTSGTFRGQIALGPSLQSGTYMIKIKSNGYLRALIPGIHTLTALKDNQIPQSTLVAGDTNSDNSLNVLDYNGLLDCGYGNVNPLPNKDPKALFHTPSCKAHNPTDTIDIDDNGIINSADYNLFVRELSVQHGE